MKGIKLQDWKVTYIQAKDTWDHSEDIYQDITFEAEDVTGDGDYYLVIKTSRWAIDADEIDDWAAHMKDFLKGNIYSKKENMPKLVTSED